MVKIWIETHIDERAQTYAAKKPAQPLHTKQGIKRSQKNSATEPKPKRPKTASSSSEAKQPQDVFTQADLESKYNSHLNNHIQTDANSFPQTDTTHPHEPDLIPISPSEILTEPSSEQYDTSTATTALSSESEIELPDGFTELHQVLSTDYIYDIPSPSNVTPGEHTFNPDIFFNNEAWETVTATTSSSSSPSSTEYMSPGPVFPTAQSHMADVYTPGIDSRALLSTNIPNDPSSLLEQGPAPDNSDIPLFTNEDTEMHFELEKNIWAEKVRATTPPEQQSWVDRIRPTSKEQELGYSSGEEDSYGFDL